MKEKRIHEITSQQQREQREREREEKRNVPLANVNKNKEKKKKKKNRIKKDFFFSSVSFNHTKKNEKTVSSVEFHRCRMN